MMEWFDIHSSALVAIGSLTAAFAAIGGWICTVVAEMRASNRSKKNYQATENLHKSVNSRMNDLLESHGLAERAKGVAEERKRNEGKNG